MTDAVGEGSLEVELELVLAVEGGQHAEVEKTALLLTQDTSPPGPTPTIFSHHFLEVPVEIIRLGERGINVFLAEHLLAVLESDFVSFSWHNGRLLGCVRGGVSLRQARRQARRSEPVGRSTGGLSLAASNGK